MAERSQLLTLPPELLQEVWRSLDKRSYKALRLSSRFCNKLSTPPLFEYFSIYPHTGSFERLVNVAETPYLAQHVRIISYNTLLSGLTEIILRRLKTVYSSQISEKDKRSMIERATELNRQNLRPETPLDEMAQITYLERAFEALPNLKKIEVTDAAGLNPAMAPKRYTDPIPHFYWQMIEETCGRFEHTMLEKGMLGQPSSYMIFSRAVLMAFHKLRQPLEDVALRGFAWAPLQQTGDFTKHSARFEGALSGLKYFELVTTMDKFFPGPGSMRNLQALLRSMTNLEALEVWFTANEEVEIHGKQMIDEDTGIACRSHFSRPKQDQFKKMPDAPARLSWSPKLRSLSLHGLNGTSKEIKTVLKHCSSSLVALTLSRLVLIPEDLDGPRACLVALLKWMQKRLHLERFLLFGYLTNGGLQNWMIEPTRELDKIGERSLWEMTRNFVLRGGLCPLENVAILPDHYDVHRRSYTTELPDVLHSPEFASDDSFEMRYDAEDEEDEDLSITDDEDIDDDLLDPPYWMSDEDLDDEDEINPFLNNHVQPWSPPAHWAD